jgi:hypothetical protein
VTQTPAVRDERIVGLRWEEFLDWMTDSWAPGEHLNLIAPTGKGKTTFLAQLLQLRKYVIAFDTKGGDRTLAGIGWRRIDKWPPPKQVWRDIEEGKPARLILGKRVRLAEYPQMLEAQRAAFEFIFDEGGWSVYLDELQMLTDPRMGKAGGQVEFFLIGARDRDISVVTGHQRTVRASAAAGDQASWIVTGRTRNRLMQDDLADRAGWARHEFRGMMAGLPSRCWIVFAPDQDVPPVVTSPPYLAPAPRP